MHKLILMSIMIASLAVPAYYSRMKDPKRGLSRTVGSMALFCGVWILSLKYVVMRIMVIPTFTP